MSVEKRFFVDQLFFKLYDYFTCCLRATATLYFIYACIGYFFLLKLLICLCVFLDGSVFVLPSSYVLLVLKKVFSMG
jgi:hypothetical protein